MPNKTTTSVRCLAAGDGTLPVNAVRAAESVLLLVTAIWGSSFVVANLALEAGFSPLGILLCRFALAAVCLGVGCRRRIAASLSPARAMRGAALGVVFMFAFYMQMLGLQYSTPSNNAIITAANVVIVPFVWWVAARVRPPAHTFLSCLVSLVGIAVISLDFSEGVRVHAGDLFSLVGAFLFAVQIVLVSEFARRMDHVTMVFVEFTVAALLSGVLFLLAGDSLPVRAGAAGWLSVLFLGIVCTIVCFILQAWSLRRLDSSRGAVIMSTEALFASMLSIAVGMDVLGWRIVVGGLLLTAAVAGPELRATFCALRSRE